MRTIEKVVEEIKSVYPNYVNPMMGDDDNQRLHDRLNEILEIHKAEKRPKGKWILFENYVGDDSYRCSECKEEALEDGMESYASNYCPNCGADMRESEEI